MQAKFTKAFIFILIFLSVCYAAHAQISVQSVSGTVKDADGHPVSSVVIYLKSTNYKTETDKQGNFKLSAPVGAYQLIISRLGFKQQTRSISISTGKDLLIPAITFTDKQQLGEVKVTQKTKTKEIKEQAFNLNVLDTRKLYNRAADLNLALNETSGVRVRQDGGVGSDFTFSLNGFSGKEVKFFLDGIPMDNFGTALTLNNFLVNMAERVEIYKGVVPISLGADALGGAVNIITRSNLNFLDASYGYGSFNTHKASINYAYTDLRTGFTVRANTFYNYSDNNYKVKAQPIDLITGQKEALQEVRRFHDAYQSIGGQFEIGVTGKKYADQLLFGLLAADNHKDIQTGVTMEQVFVDNSHLLINGGLG